MSLKSEKPKEFNVAAHQYAWEWFRFHAEQRLKLFQFYILIVGAYVAGIVNLAEKTALGSLLFSLLFLLVSVIFIRFDQRNKYLIKVSESYLKASEIKLAENHDDLIRLTHYADLKSPEFGQVFLPKFLYSYSQLVRSFYGIMMVATVINILYFGAALYSNL